MPYGHILKFISHGLCWLTPFTFVLCMILALRKAVRDDFGRSFWLLTAGAAASLFLLMIETSNWAVLV